MASGPATPTILVVDDDAETRQGIAEILRHEGFAVATAADGAEALDYLRASAGQQSYPCLILLDLVMPVNGWQFHEELSKDTHLAAIPIAVMSGVYNAEAAGRRFRAVATFSKPIDSARLLALVRQCCCS